MFVMVALGRGLLTVEGMTLTKCPDGLKIQAVPDRGENSRIRIPQGRSPARVSLLLCVELLSERDLGSKALQYTNREA